MNTTCIGRIFAVVYFQEEKIEIKKGYSFFVLYLYGTGVKDHMTIREELEKREYDILSPFAAYSDQSKGRDKPEEQCDLYIRETEIASCTPRVFAGLRGRHRSFWHLPGIIIAIV